MKKLFPLLLCLLLLTACGKASTDQGAESSSASVVNPWTDQPSLDAATRAVGIELSVPETINGYDPPIYRTMAGLIEVLYRSDTGEIRIRKASSLQTEGSDISGDYNVYLEHTAIPTVGEDATITLDGNDGTVSRALWSVNGFDYSITVDPATNVQTLSALTAQVS